MKKILSVVLKGILGGLIGYGLLLGLSYVSGLIYALAGGSVVALANFECSFIGMAIAETLAAVFIAGGALIANKR